jgi:hypothetical protein
MTRDFNLQKNLTEAEYKDLVAALPQTEFGKGQVWSNGKYTFQMFPEGYIALNRELATGFHPKLEKLLANHPVDEVDIKLAEIASHCLVVLDGTYTIAERDRLCFILAGRLEAIREVPDGVTVQ